MDDEVGASSEPHEVATDDLAGAAEPLPAGENEDAPEDLEVPEDTASIYEARGDVPLFLPIMQGDVFRDIELPGFPDGPHVVQVVMHPCSMRKGAKLYPRITVAPVVPTQDVSPKIWVKAGRQMPLPELTEPGGSNYRTNFVDITAVPSDRLRLEQRICALSQYGVLILQQRIVWHHSRVVVPTKRLFRQAVPVLVELELQSDWVEAALDGSAETDDALAVATADYQAWLDEDDSARRFRLKNETEHASLRREVRAEIRRRRSEQG